MSRKTAWGEMVDEAVEARMSGGSSKHSASLRGSRDPLSADVANFRAPLHTLAATQTLLHSGA